MAAKKTDTITHNESGGDSLEQTAQKMCELATEKQTTVSCILHVIGITIVAKPGDTMKDIIEQCRTELKSAHEAFQKKYSMTPIEYKCTRWEDRPRFKRLYDEFIDNPTIPTLAAGHADLLAAETEVWRIRFLEQALQMPRW